MTALFELGAYNEMTALLLELGAYNEMTAFELLRTTELAAATRIEIFMRLSYACNTITGVRITTGTTAHGGVRMQLFIMTRDLSAVYIKSGWTTLRSCYPHQCGWVGWLMRLIKRQ